MSTGTITMHAEEASRMAALAADAADTVGKAGPDTAAAAAASAAASAHAAAATASNLAGGRPDARKAVAATTISPKLWTGTVAAAIAFSFWTIAAATFWKHTFNAAALAALTGSTTAILAAVGSYLKTDPLRSS